MTRILEFGRYAIERRARRGQRCPETFDLLGFTLKAIRASLMRQRHAPNPSTGAWLKSVVQCYLNYYAVPENLKRLGMIFAVSGGRPGRSSCDGLRRRSGWSESRNLRLDFRSGGANAAERRSAPRSVGPGCTRYAVAASVRACPGSG